MTGKGGSAVREAAAPLLRTFNPGGDKVDSLVSPFLPVLPLLSACSPLPFCPDTLSFSLNAQLCKVFPSLRPSNERSHSLPLPLPPKETFLKPSLLLKAARLVPGWQV